MSIKNFIVISQPSLGTIAIIHISYIISKIAMPHMRVRSTLCRHLAGLITWSLFLGLDTTLIIWQCTCRCRRRRRRGRRCLLLSSSHWVCPSDEKFAKNVKTLTRQTFHYQSTGQTPLEVAQLCHSAYILYMVYWYFVGQVTLSVTASIRNTSTRY